MHSRCCLRTMNTRVSSACAMEMNWKTWHQWTDSRGELTRNRFVCINTSTLPPVVFCAQISDAKPISLHIECEMIFVRRKVRGRTKMGMAGQIETNGRAGLG